MEKGSIGGCQGDLQGKNLWVWEQYYGKPATEHDKDINNVLSYHHSSPD